MALTPEDVVNKRFQPTKFREGYDQDEVDDFLDEVVVELRRLNQENEELRQRLVASDSRIAELQRSSASAAPESSTVAQPVPAGEPTPAPAPAAPAEPATSATYTAPPLDETGSTNNLLQLARRLHEEHVREGIEKRDSLIAEGHATAARIISDAEAQQRQQLSSLEKERAVLENQIDELRTFERDYRQNLKSYIENQLKELDTSEPMTAEGSAPGGTPTPASSTPSAAPYQGFGGN